MASRYVILKKTRSQVNIKVVGDGTTSVVIPLSVFGLADEIALTPSANIRSMNWTVDQTAGLVTITRGVTPTQYLYGSDKWDISQSNGISDSDTNTGDITVAITGGKPGTVFLCFSKFGWSFTGVNGVSNS